MCEPASFILTKDRAYWSKLTDSHKDIIAEFGLHTDGAKGPKIVRVEITPPDGKFDAPLDQWKYKVDQDQTPKWFDAAEGEQAARLALVEWAAFHVHAVGSCEVKDGKHWASGNASVEAYGGILRFWSAIKLTIKGTLTVAIDMRGNAAFCHVGTDTERVIATTEGR